jgi:hypothetical protein
MPDTVPYNSYSVVVEAAGRPKLWTWEIRREPPLGIKLKAESGFSSEQAAKLAGEKALYAFLQSIDREDSNA